VVPGLKGYLSMALSFVGLSTNPASSTSLRSKCSRDFYNSNINQLKPGVSQQTHFAEITSESSFHKSADSNVS
jgi:hypothetical protein